MQQELLDFYNEIKNDIQSRKYDFKGVWDQGNERIFEELAFCLFTPQSKAEACWQAVMNLKRKRLLFNGDSDKLEEHMKSVRFYKIKSKRLVEARKLSGIKNKIKDMSQEEAREWIVSNVNGLGYKEASHFLRNIGFADKLMILDRHILRNLVDSGVIEKIPKTLSTEKYFEIEEKMKQFSNALGIPASELDLLWWAKETGKVFK